MVDPDEIVEFNGMPTAIKNLPVVHRVLCGMGHDMWLIQREKREVIPGNWPYIPEDCLRAGETKRVWINDGQDLVCPGCGIDCT